MFFKANKYNNHLSTMNTSSNKEKLNSYYQNDASEKCAKVLDKNNWLIHSKILIIYLEINYLFLLRNNSDGESLKSI